MPLDKEMQVASSVRSLEWDDSADKSMKYEGVFTFLYNGKAGCEPVVINASKMQGPITQTGKLGDDRFVSMVRKPQKKIPHELRNRFVSVNRKTYSGAPWEIRTRTHRRFWNARLDAIENRLLPADLIAGKVIWKHLNLYISPRKTAGLMS